MVHGKTGGFSWLRLVNKMKKKNRKKDDKKL